MTLATKIIFITALILSIILPFGYYLLGKEKSRRRYKRAIGTNAFFFFGAFAVASIMLLGGPNVQAAGSVTADSGFATGLGYLAAALVRIRHRPRIPCGSPRHRPLLHRRRHRRCQRGKRGSRRYQRRLQRTR